MSEYVSLTMFDILLASAFILVCIIISFLLKLGLAKDLVIASLRTVLQLSLAGLVLGAVFKLDSFISVSLLMGVMILIAAREANARQDIRLKGTWMDGLAALCISASVVGFSVTIFIVKAAPWWTPSVAIPLVGMIIGNSMNGITLAMDRFLSGCTNRKHEIETHLSLGASAQEATNPLVRESLRAGMTPIINSMMIVGIVSLPGMMTGQLIAGIAPWDAVKYQIVVMYMITAATAFGSIISVLLTRKRLFTKSCALRSDLFQVK